MMTEALRDAELALYDIDPVRLEQSKPFFLPFRRHHWKQEQLRTYCGVRRERKPQDALFG